MRKIYFLILLLGVISSCWAQSINQNYIKTTTYLYPTSLPLVVDSMRVSLASGGISLNPRFGPTQVKVVYFDGLGRPKQEVIAGSSSAAGNIVTHIGYEVNLGQTKTFLPFSTQRAPPNGGIGGAFGSSNPVYVSDAEQATLNFYNTPKYQNTTNPYSEVVLEASPLKQVIKSAAPGNDWKISAASDNRNIEYKNALNTTNQVKKFTATESIFVDNSTGLIETNLVNSGYHAKNSLYWNTVKDESKGFYEEFKDAQGQVVLQRTRYMEPVNIGPFASKGVDFGPVDEEHFLLGTVLFYTYYVYDDFGNLRYVLPPLAAGKTDTETLNKLCYQYKYDYKNRMVAKKLPGKDWEYLVYDKADRLIATGPVLSPFGDQSTGWLFTKYDVFNRVVYSGFYTGLPTTAVGRKQFETELQNQAFDFEFRGERDELPISGIAMQYTNRCFPKTAVQILSVNYFDNYSFDTSLAQLPAVEGVVVKTNVKGLPTGNWNRVITTANESLGELSYTLYDFKNRAVRTYLKNHLGGFTQTDLQLNFRGLPISTTTTHTATQASADQPTVIKENFAYNHAEQLVSHTHQVGNGEAVVLTKNDYDNLRVLTSKEVGGLGGTAITPPLQKVSFKYNIRGWLTEINDVHEDGVQASNNPLFSLKLNYNRFDTYSSPGSGPVLSLTQKAMYNGNIAEQLWRSNDGVLKSYNYNYDGLNRLKSAFYSLPKTINPITRAYDESLTYDKNGNILTLKRNGNTTANNVIEIDDLDYTYDGNQLQKVTDATNNAEGFKKGTHTGNDYAYDSFGNLIIDKNKGITQIKYNHLNLPTEITMTAGKINYIYNAAGVKLQKKVVPTNGAVTTTDYLGAFQYENNQLQFFPTVEGYYNVQTNKYVYQYKDHLGNVRLSYSDTNGDGLITADEVLSENNYYPFGLQHQGDNPAVAQANPAAEKYKYNAKELQDELGLNFYDYGARNYDAALGRWFNVDPLAEQTMEPYSYVGNNPINFTDPTGMSKEGVENDCDSCKTKADWQAYYQQAENTASMIGEDAWEGLNNKRMSRAIDDNGNSIFYLDGKKMDLRTYENKTHAIGSLLGDAALIEGGARLFKYFSNAFSKSKDVAKGGSSVLLNTSKQLQAKFKHAGDFGVIGNYNKANAGKFSSAINQHINSAGVQTIQGTYRGQSVIHYVNPNTGLNVISSPTGQFMSGWKLNPAQLQNVLKHGGL
ncbi:colicin D domain-containing protein [Flavobacterium sp. NKUCC04_CG]|uniref:DUF6443 domain-containing protein n=1 Tax=Flavobacterium sp. NKUCC04_CG TaxID=2842121 RepID=UPI001C5A8B9E|nr:colicin D domain-containing protein [Flavobacterium sp. NKUCC04_CG]MBW3518755.1 type IV secretion protein Rhs [Flavobacterium sp. NKUCC04_CG]